MGEPVRVEIDLELLNYIRVTLADTADDLKAHIDAKYPPDLRDKYPSYARRYKNEMEVVTDARYCLSQINAMPHNKEHYR